MMLIFKSFHHLADVLGGTDDESMALLGLDSGWHAACCQVLPDGLKGDSIYVWQVY